MRIDSQFSEPEIPNKITKNKTEYVINRLLELQPQQDVQKKLN